MRVGLAGLHLRRLGRVDKVSEAIFYHFQTTLVSVTPGSTRGPASGDDGQRKKNGWTPDQVRGDDCFCWTEHELVHAACRSLGGDEFSVSAEAPGRTLTPVQLWLTGKPVSLRILPPIKGEGGDIAPSEPLSAFASFRP